MITRLTDPPRCPAASAREVKRPVDSITTSAPSLSHGKLLGLALRQDADVLIAHEEVVALDVDRHREPSLRRVVAQQVRQGLGGGQVVHPDHLDVGTGVEDRSQEIAADASEAIDSDPHRHLVPSSRVPGDLCQQTGERLRQFGRAVHQRVLSREGNVEHRDIRRADVHTLDAVTHHHVHLDIVPGQGRNMGCDVEALGLGDLWTEVADVDDRGSGGGHRLGDASARPRRPGRW